MSVYCATCTRECITIPKVPVSHLPCLHWPSIKCCPVSSDLRHHPQEIVRQYGEYPGSCDVCGSSMSVKQLSRHGMVVCPADCDWGMCGDCRNQDLRNPDPVQGLVNFCKTHNIIAAGTLEPDVWNAATGERYIALVRALFWRLIVRFQVGAAIPPADGTEFVREILGKDAIRTWSDETAHRKCGTRVKNFRSDWSDGMALLSLLDHAIEFFHGDGGGDTDEELLEKVNAIVRHLDADGNGYMDVGEVKNFVADMAGCDAGDIEDDHPEVLALAERPASELAKKLTEMADAAEIHGYHQRLGLCLPRVDFEAAKSASAEENLQKAFDGFAAMGVPAMLPMDVALGGQRRDALLMKSCVTYIASIWGFLAKTSGPAAVFTSYRYPSHISTLVYSLRACRVPTDPDAAFVLARRQNSYNGKFLDILSQSERTGDDGTTTLRARSLSTAAVSCVSQGAHSA